jgi:hypothetical protein
VENVLQASNNVFKLCDFGVLPHQSRLDCRRPRLRWIRGALGLTPIQGSSTEKTAHTPPSAV